MTCIREVPGSHRDRALGLRRLPQFLHVNAGIVPRLGQERFLPDHFKFNSHLSPGKWTLYNRSTRQLYKINRKEKAKAL
jgi:hypothetical protein